jgi:hypothetical protein
MMGRIKTGLKRLHSTDYASEQDGLASVWLSDAPPAAVEAVLNAAEGDEFNGRSQWVWMRFPNGDLFLATAPQGAFTRGRAATDTLRSMSPMREGI